jgi:hypothetical protein
MSDLTKPAAVSLGALLVTLLLNACAGGGSSTPDMAPVGDGLSLIGMGIVLAAIIGLIGILVGPHK